MKNNKEIFERNLENEMKEFRNTTLELSPKEIYDRAREIFFFEETYKYLGDQSLSRREYKAFATEEKPIANLWCRIKEWEHFNVGDMEDTETVIHQFVKDTLSETCM